MAKAKPLKTRQPGRLADPVLNVMWQWRWMRPGYKTARRALAHFQADLKEIQRTRKWLHR